MGKEQFGNQHQDRMVGRPIWARSYGTLFVKKIGSDWRNSDPAYTLYVEGMVCTNAKR